MKGADEIQKILRHAEHQELHRRQSQATAVHGDGVEGARHDADAQGGLDLKLDLTHVIDGFHGNEHTLPITPLYKDVLQIFAQSGIASTPTLIVNYGGPFGEDYCYEYTEVHDNAKLNHFTPHKYY